MFTPGPGRPPTILIVDDDQSSLYALGRTLIEKGFAVLMASDYREALDQLDGQKPIDLLITDIMMPGHINGFALGRMARMKRLGLPTIYVTGFDVPEDEAIGAILRKPLSPGVTLAAIESALAPRSAPDASL